MYLFFDTETTGVPRDYKAPMTDLENWPRVIQLAWQLADDTGEVVQERKFLVKPDGWEVPSVEFFKKQGFNESQALQKAEFWIKHGYTTEQNEKEGEEMDELLDIFISDYEQSKMMVAHNMGYDYPVLGSEMIRYGKNTERKITRFCTMLATVDYCQLPGRYGFKWPKLEELHRQVFGETFDGAHDALNDVTACRKCFFELKNRGVIVLP